jgi:hypothetical protein
MSFTQDELQAFNSILEQKLAAHRREMERSLDQHLAALKRDFEQRLTTLQRDMLRRLPQRITEQQKLTNPPVQITTSPQEPVQTAPPDESNLQAVPAQQLESAVERGLAAQLLAIEQLINQRIPTQTTDWSPSYLTGVTGESGDLAGIEIQTDLPWEELVEVVDSAMDQRINLLRETLQANIQDMTNYLSVELHAIRGDLARLQMPAYNGDLTSFSEFFSSIEQLEHIIESMQVAMNANHSLLSNRMFHHQQLPLERAHPGNGSTTHNEPKNGITKPLPLLKGHENEQQQS